MKTQYYEFHTNHSTATQTEHLVVDTLLGHLDITY